MTRSVFSHFFHHKKGDQFREGRTRDTLFTLLNQFLKFHAVFKKKCLNNRLVPPPLELAPLHLGNPTTVKKHTMEAKTRVTDKS